MKRITIIAEDHIGRTEECRLLLSPALIKRFEQACRNNELHDYIAYILDDYFYNHLGGNTVLSQSQYYRLRNFTNNIYHMFYNYNLKIEKSWT